MDRHFRCMWHMQATCSELNSGQYRGCLSSSAATKHTNVCGSMQAIWCCAQHGTQTAANDGEAGLEQINMEHMKDMKLTCGVFSSWHSQPATARPFKKPVV